MAATVQFGKVGEISVDGQARFFDTFGGWRFGKRRAQMDDGISCFEYLQMDFEMVVQFTFRLETAHAYCGKGAGSTVGLNLVIRVHQRLHSLPTLAGDARVMSGLRQAFQLDNYRSQPVYVRLNQIYTNTNLYTDPKYL